MNKYIKFTQIFTAPLIQVGRNEDIPYNPDKSETLVTFHFPYQLTQDQFEVEKLIIAKEIIDSYEHNKKTTKEM